VQGVTITDELRTVFQPQAVVLDALRAETDECQALAGSLSDEQATQSLTVTDELHAVFQPQAVVLLLSDVPPELLAIILAHLRTRDLASLAATCRPLWCDAPPHPLLTSPSLPVGLVEAELRRRAEARGLHLPEGAQVQYLLKREFNDALRRHAPLAVGMTCSLFVDTECRLRLACPRTKIQAGQVGAPLLGHLGSEAGDSTVFVPFMLVTSMQDTRIVSVAVGHKRCLALSAEAEVYSWGDAEYGVLGHADGGARNMPSRIETLERVESIVAGMSVNAAVDDRGSLFAWGRAWKRENVPGGLGYELDPSTACQLTPKRVDALSEDRVVGAALGHFFTVAVTDAGAFFFFGTIQHGSSPASLSESETLPRRSTVLAQTGRRFVAVAACDYHILTLTEEGELYGWGDELASGHGSYQHTLRRVAALLCKRIRLVYAEGSVSCAVTENGELYTWGGLIVFSFYTCYHLGHGSAMSQPVPKRVEALRDVATVAICSEHTLAADEDGVVWAFGERASLALCDADAPPGNSVRQPTPIPNLRVRTLDQVSRETNKESANTSGAGKKKTKKKKKKRMKKKMAGGAEGNNTGGNDNDGAASGGGGSP